MDVEIVVECIGGSCYWFDCDSEWSVGVVCCCVYLYVIEVFVLL